MITQLLRRVEKVKNKNKKIVVKRTKKYLKDTKKKIQQLNRKYLKDTKKKIQQLNRKYVKKVVASSMAIKMVAYVTILVAISANYQPAVSNVQAWNSHLKFDKTKDVPLTLPSNKVSIKVEPIVAAAAPVAEAAAKTTKSTKATVKSTTRTRTTTARERATTQSATPVTAVPVEGIKAYALERSNATFGAGQFPALETLWNRESGWNSASTNRSSGACGIPQANPCSKAGGDYRTNAQTQVNWGLNYIKSRYGNPANALAFWNKHHWY